MTIDSSTLGHNEVCKLMMACIVPRPIAGVTTMFAEGVVYAVSISAFGSVSTEP